MTLRSKQPTLEVAVGESLSLPQLLGLPHPELRRLPTSQSLVTTAEFCPRKALLSYGFGLRRVGRPAAADRAATALAVGWSGWSSEECPKTQAADGVLEPSPFIEIDRRSTGSPGIIGTGFGRVAPVMRTGVVGRGTYRLISSGPPR